MGVHCWRRRRKRRRDNGGEADVADVLVGDPGGEEEICMVVEGAVPGWGVMAAGMEEQKPVTDLSYLVVVGDLRQTMGS